MGQQTNIEWCDATLNLWWGCTKVSDGCKFCYAEHLSDQRYKKGAWGPTGTRTEIKSWRATLGKISRRATAEGRRFRVFVQSMSDTFEGPETMGGSESENWALASRLRIELMMAIQDHPELDFLLLTKRPENAATFFAQQAPDGSKILDRLRNIWIGTSVEDQKTADKRIPHLLNIPAAVRFLSCEPLLGPVELWDEGFVCKRCGKLLSQGTEEDAEYELPCTTCGCNQFVLDLPTDRATFGIPDQGIDWVICGGESGPNARPMHPDWPRSLRDQCVAAGVPFFFKQWGEWHPRMRNGVYPDDPDGFTTCDHLPTWWVAKGGYHLDGTKDSSGNDSVLMKRVGRKRAGRRLDGLEWNEFPEVGRFKGSASPS